MMASNGNGSKELIRQLLSDPKAKEMFILTTLVDIKEMTGDNHKRIKALEMWRTLLTGAWLAIVAVGGWLKLK